MLAFYTQRALRGIWPALLFAAGLAWSGSTVLYGLSVLNEGPWRAVYGIWRPLYSIYPVHAAFFIFFGLAIFIGTLLAAWLYYFGRWSARKRLYCRMLRRTWRRAFGRKVSAGHRNGRERTA